MDEPLEVARNTVFTLEIPSSPTTGYRWRVAQLPASVELRDATFRNRADAAIGDGGTQIFHLVATEPGEFRISLECGRPWEQQPIEVRSVPIRVR